MTKIFVSYRRSDSQERAHRIADWLVLKYGKDNIFIDVDRIPGGVDFVDVIEQSLAASDVLLVVVGDTWDSELAERAKSPNIDFVRFEVAYGLKNIPLVIPVLTEHGVSIDKNLLPEDVQGLLQHNFMYARLTDFHQDMERIRSQIPETDKKGLPLPLLASGFVGIAIIAIVLYLMFGGNGTDSTITDTPNPEQAALMTRTAANLPSATPTDDTQATIDAIVIELAETDSAATQDILNQQSTETEIALEAQQATETHAVQVLTNEALTQNAQLTANAPTNTPLPTDTPTETSTPTPQENFTETAEAATAAQNAIHTQAVQTAVEVNNARNTATAEAQNVAATQDAHITETAIVINGTATMNAQNIATVNSINGTATANAQNTAIADSNTVAVAVVGSTGSYVRTEPETFTGITRTLEAGEQLTVLAYVVNNSASNPYWVQVEDGYVWLGSLTSVSQIQVENAAENGKIPTIVLSSVNAVVGSVETYVRTEPETFTGITRTLEAGEQLTVLAYIINNSASNPYWVQVEDGYVWLGSLTSVSQIQVENAAENGKIPTIVLSSVNAVVGSSGAYVRTEPETFTGITRTLEAGEQLTVLVYVINNSASNPYWVQVEDGYVWLGSLTSVSQIQVENAAQNGKIPTIEWGQ